MENVELFEISDEKCLVRMMCFDACYDYKINAWDLQKKRIFNWLILAIVLKEKYD